MQRGLLSWSNYCRPQDFRVRVNVLAKCVEHYAVKPIPPYLHPFDFIAVFQ